MLQNHKGILWIMFIFSVLLLVLETQVLGQELGGIGVNKPARPAFQNHKEVLPILPCSIILNGEEKKSFFQTEIGGQELAGALWSVPYGYGSIDSAETNFGGGLRIMTGIKYNWLGLYSDIEFKSRRNNFGKTEFNPNILNQLYIQFDDVANLPLKFRVGKFRTAAGQAVPYDYNEILAKGHSVGEPFVGLYGFGAQLSVDFSSKINFTSDITGRTKNFGPKQNYGYHSKEYSARLHVNVPQHYLNLGTAFQISSEFVRYYIDLEWYNPRGSIFFLDGAFFNESSNEEQFFGYRGTIGIRLGEWFEWHLQVENGPIETYDGKQTLISNGITISLDRDKNKYVFVVDHETPLDNSPRGEQINFAFLAFLDF